jgi:hypothetical protein
MRRRNVLALPLTTMFAAVFAASLAGCVSTRGPSVALDAGAPDFTLTSHQGQEVSLTSLLRNGPAVLVFYRGYW